MVEVIIDGVSIDLLSTKVKYTKQVNDLADISTIDCSYSYTLEAKKTPKNTKLFQQLGMVGDTSDFPYTKNSTQLIDNGSVLIQKGITTVKKTESDTYRIYIQDGIIDIFKIIENKSIGETLNLEELEHVKTAQTIIESWQSGSAYRYLIADYNGQTYDGQAINAQYQIPSVSYSYLWEKLFNYLGYSYTGDFNFIQGKWISYPKPPEIGEEEIIERFAGTSIEYEGDGEGYKEWESVTVQNAVTIINDWRVRLNLTGNYNIRFYGIGNIEYDTKSAFIQYTITAPFKIVLLRNGEEIGESIFSNDVNPDNNFSGILQADDELELEVQPLSAEEFTQLDEFSDFPASIQNIIQAGGLLPREINIQTLGLQIETTGIETIDFQSALKDFSLKDFFKETLIRGGLTPIVNNIERHIDFISLEDRLSTDNAIDFSDKYVSREDEEYIFQSYAQKNHLKLKYNNEDDNYFDGALFVSNENIEDQKTLFTSKFYATDRGNNNITIRPNSTELMVLARMWEKEIKEDENGDQEIEYKPLSNHFYLLSEKRVQKTINVNNESNSFFYKASSSGTTMPEVLNSKYRNIDKIFTDTRIHNINLALSAYDVATLDLGKLYYFRQEAQFYIFNRLIWETGSVCKGEFLRVKK